MLWQVTYGVEMNKFGMPQARLFWPKPSADLGPQLAKLMQVSLFSGPRFSYSWWKPTRPSSSQCRKGHRGKCFPFIPLFLHVFTIFWILLACSELASLWNSMISMKYESVWQGGTKTKASGKRVTKGKAGGGACRHRKLVPQILRVFMLDSYYHIVLLL